MARNTGSAAAASNNNTGSAANASRSPGASFERASGFVNISLMDKSGTKVKLGYIPLVDSNERQKKLVEWLKADPKNIETLARKLVIEFNPGKTGPDADFDLE